MAENGNRGPNDFRARTGKRRREPPIIDASATEVPVDARADDPFDAQAGFQPDADAKDATIPDTTDAAPLPAAEPQAHAAAVPDAAVSDEAVAQAAREASEPVLFASARRDPPAGAEPIRPSDAADLPAEDRPRAEPTAIEPGNGLGAAPATGATASSGGGGAPAATVAAARTGGGAMPWILSLCILALLGALAWTLYTEPQRNGRNEIADLRGKVAALEARPDPTQAQAQAQSTLAALDKRLSAADADRQALAKTVGDLTSRLDAVAQQAQQPAPGGPAPSGAEAAATVGALGALAAKLDGLDGRVADLATAQGQTAKSVADLPKPVTPDFGPVDARVAALDGRVTALDGKVNGSDARLNAFDAKVNAVDGKINGFEARMNGFENRTNGIEAKLNDDSTGLGKLQATVANLPRVDLAPLQAAAGALDGRVAKVEGQLAASKDGERVTEARAVGSADEARATPIALVGQAVARAVTDGRPYASDLAALKALGAEPDAIAKLSPLAEQGAPTAAALRDRWNAVQGDVLSTVRPSEPGSALERFAANARNLVQVRRVGAVQGDDPAALVSQIDAALASGDVQGALATWSRLPQAGQDRSRDWAAAARSRVEAGDAAQGIVSRAIATLARTKS